MNRRSLTILAILLSTTIVASAFATLDLSPNSQKIKIGKTGHYSIILKTDVMGPTALQWSTGDPNILASINGMPPGQFGTFNFNSNGKAQVFDLDVTPQTGVVVGKTYHIKVQFLDTVGEVEALVTGDVVPTPELSTGLLVAAGLIGLFGIVRYKRKE